ncbi:putative MFS-type transporter [Wickerhamomyces ciferrii]|uniref:MFS-type transporter n=1 Tax=Wickerhamomyces ciferrii (strain ATCC 14091 / BCRC 22168 / CBS 111 / JCM 3599 / NBRC 0793 / NRRL Y-1031 F-60-10) TaxID=1206466 RepID=K0KHL8_WICCF|nr:putative MFS-type transporter [Wickerhamomyces ciferrii]CCH40658.1 putative MFS-type transporter [Wickerhamomyces ciferrii]
MSVSTNNTLLEEQKRKEEDFNTSQRSVHSLSSDAGTSSPTSQDPQPFLKDQETKNKHNNNDDGEKDDNEDNNDENQLKQIPTQQSLSKKLGDSHDNLLAPTELKIVLLAMSLSLMVAFIDQNGIAIVLPSIADELNANLTISWAGTSQLIANCCFQLLYGRLADIFGRKYVLLACIILLGFFDLACGLAKTDVQFFVFRGITGIANGGVTSLAMVIMSDHVTLKDRGKYQGYLTSSIGIGNAIGPFLASGFQQHSNWRNYYYTLFSIVTASSGLIWWYLPNSHSPISIKEKLLNIDYLGFLFSSVGLILVLIPINGGGLTFAWDEPKVIIMFAVGGFCLLTFLVIEWKVAKLPMLPFRLFTSPTLCIVFVQCFLFGLCYYPLFYYYTYYFEVVKDLSPIITACFFLCVVLPHAFMSAMSGKIVTKTGHYNPVLWAGYTLWTLGFGLLSGVVKVNTPYVGIAFIMILNGLGQGMTFQNTLIAALAHSKPQDRAVVISTRNVLRSFGGSFGMAFSSLIFATSFTKDINSNKFINEPAQSHLKSYLKEHVYSKVDLNQIKVSSEQHLYIKELYNSCTKNVFTFWAPLIGTCFVLSWFIKDRGVASKSDQEREKKIQEEKEAANPQQKV